MSFALPVVLFLTPVVLLMLGALLLRSEQRRRQMLAALGNPAQIARLTSAVDARLRRMQRVLWLAAAALLMVALARPQWGEEVRTVQREGLQVVLALDVSTSMLADDLKPNRLTRAKLELGDLIGRLNGDEVALVLFSGAAFVQFPLTSDYNTARQFLQSAMPGAISQPGTDLGEAIATAVEAFDDNSNAQRVLVILTDGEAHDADALAQAQAAADAGVRIYTVGLGSPDGAPVPQLDLFGNVVGQKVDADGVPVVTRLDEATLQKIAEIGGGTYALAEPTGSHLDQLLLALGTLQEGAFGEQVDVTRIERYQPFVALALILLVAATLLPDRSARQPRVAASDVRPGRRRVVQPRRQATAEALALPEVEA